MAIRVACAMSLLAWSLGAGAGASENLVTKNEGDNLTDLRLHWNDMRRGCLRAFAFDGDTTDEMRNGDGSPTDLSYDFHRYSGLGHLKYDYNRCAIFNGSSAKVDIGNAEDLRNLSSVSISAWICVASSTDSPKIYFKDSIGPGAMWFGLSDCPESEQECRLSGYVNCALREAYALSSNTIRLGRWYHAAMTWDGSQVDLFINGDEVSYSKHIDAKGEQSNDARNDAFIGARVHGEKEDSFFNGYMADVFVYDHPLAPGEMEWLAGTSEFRVTPNLGAMGEYGNFPPGQMQSPAYAVEDKDGNIWVSEFGVPRVTKLSSAGEVLITIGGKRGTKNGLFYGPWGLALDEDDNLYVCDEGNSRIQVFDKDGKFLRKWGSPGSGNGQFRFNYCLACDDDYVYVTDAGNHRIQKFTKDGTFVTKWGKKGPGDHRQTDSEFFSVQGITNDNQGNVWVLDRGLSGDINFMKKFSPDGTFLYKFMGDYPVGPMGHGLAYSPDGHLYSACGDMQRDGLIFNKYNVSGSRVKGWGQRGTGEDQTLSAWGVFYTPRGTILTTDWFGCKLQEWETDGDFIRSITGTRLQKNGYSIKCKNAAQQPNRFWQKTGLADGWYTLSFRAFTDGSAVKSDDLVPFAGPRLYEQDH